MWTNDAFSASERYRASQAEFTALLRKTLTADGEMEPMPGLTFFRASAPSRLIHTMFAPAFCVVGGGSKEVLLGNERFVYDQDHYLISALELPVSSRVITASEDAPYLSMRLSLEPSLVASVMVEAGVPTIRSSGVKAMHVRPTDPDLMDAGVRIARLLDQPSQAGYLFPIITREIVYRLLMGDQGARLAHIATLGGTSSRIASAIQRIRLGFSEPIRVDDVARDIGMSVSGFHHHFKSVTGMSPLQFQKQLRLQEARRLLLSTDLDAASVGYSVGYDNASHFSREYKRLFGEPPIRDVQKLRSDDALTPALT